MGTLKPQSNGPLYSNTVPGTLAADGWAVTFGTARMGLSGLRCTKFILFDVALYCKGLRATYVTINESADPQGKF